MTKEKTTALIWLSYPKAGWLWVKDGEPTALYNHMHDYINNIKIADEDNNPQAWEKVLEFIEAGGLQNIKIDIPTRSSANSNPSFPDKLPQPPDEDLRISEALAYGYHTTNIKGNPQSTVTTAGGPVEVRMTYNRAGVEYGII
jgi:hypothetical protein